MVPLEKDEYIIREVRRHWFFIMLQILSSLIMAIVPALLFIGTLFLTKTEAVAALQVYIVILSPLWLLFIWMAFFYFWTEYYLDVLIVTNKRILDIDQQNLFQREISTFPLENIQDITIQISGLLPTLLKFGNIEVQTAGENQGFNIKDAADPEAVKQVITDAHDKALDKMKNKVL